MAGTRVFGRIVLLAAILSVLAGCGAFFGFNAFAGIDKAPPPDPARYQGPGGLANLQTDLESPSVVAAMKNDPQAVNQILNNLNTSYGLTTTPITTPDQQTAAILYSQLALQSTSGDVLVNNIVTTVINNPSGNLQSMLASIVPPDVAADPVKFTAMVNNLLAAETVYVNLGTNLNPSFPPPGMNMGDVAQKAAVSLLMKTIYDAATAKVGAGNEITNLFALINNQPSNGLDKVTITDPYNPMPTWLKNIFDAAGAPYPA